MKTSLSIIASLSIAPCVHAFAGINAKNNVETGISRRESFANIASVVGGIAGVTSLPNVANAMPSDETARIISRMGGLLVSEASTAKSLFRFIILMERCLVNQNRLISFDFHENQELVKVSLKDDYILIF